MDKKELTAKEQHEQVIKLCNNVLYVLQHGYYPGEDAHLVELSKQFVKELKDMQTSALAAAQPVEAAVEAK